MEPIVSELLGADHEALADLLRELELELGKHESGKGFELLDLFWARLAVHIRAENLCLFPKLLNAPRELFSDGCGLPSFENAKSIIESLRADHNFFMDELSRAVKTMREVTSGLPEPTLRQARMPALPIAERFAAIRDRVTAVTARLVAHNELEEEQVYRWPALVLSRPELESLSAALKRELENMPPRFALVREPATGNCARNPWDGYDVDR